MEPIWISATYYIRIAEWGVLVVGPCLVFRGSRGSCRILDSSQVSVGL